MKKIILLFLIILSGIAFSQTNGVIVGDGAVWTDSLGYEVGVVSDSVWILKTNLAYSKYRIILAGNANSPVDSVALQLGSVRYSNDTPIDTVWSTYTGVKVAAGTINVRMVNTSVGADFLLEDPCALLFKFKLMNNRATLRSRNVTLTINAKK